VDTLQDRANIGGRLYPHALRAAAALYWAEKGLEAHYLQAFMGWKDMRVAVRYIRATGNKLADRINQLTSATSGTSAGTVPSDEEDYMVTDPDELPDPTDAISELTRDGNPRSDSEPEYLNGVGGDVGG